MARLTVKQIDEIKKIIQEYMSVIGQLVVGGGKPSPTFLSRLGLPTGVTDLIKNAYQYGRLGIALGTKDISRMPADDVKKLLETLKLTPSQQRSVEQAKIRAQQGIDNLPQRITSGVVTAAINSDLSMWQAVKEVVPEATKQGTERYKVIQQLRDMTQDWNRDWHRVAHTEMWDAKVKGEAEAILNNESPLSKKGADTMVFKRPAPNACPKCKQLYLESDGVTPKVFKLSDMVALGTNFGKKQADWQPVVGTVHPNCMCVLNVIPDDAEFDSNGNLVYKPKKS